MGISIDGYYYDYEELCKALEKKGAKDRGILDTILQECGVKLGDYYVIINNEYYDGYSPYFNVAGVIDRVFDIEDSFGDVFCAVPGLEKGSIPTGVDEQDVIDKVMRIKLGTEKP